MFGKCALLLAVLFMPVSALADTLYVSAPAPVGPGHPLRLGPDHRAEQTGDLLHIQFNFAVRSSSSDVSTNAKQFSAGASNGATGTTSGIKLLGGLINIPTSIGGSTGSRSASCRTVVLSSCCIFVLAPTDWWCARVKAFRGGWFHSGDLGVWHPDGYIELRDRAKDIIISGGENISTIEVEQTIAQHPAVLECAVIAIPDEVWGERPKAFVTVRAGQSPTEEELLAFCRERLAHFKCPAAVEFGNLPKTSTGKVQKFVLREKEWARYEKRIN